MLSYLCRLFNNIFNTQSQLSGGSQNAFFNKSNYKYLQNKYNNKSGTNKLSKTISVLYFWLNCNETKELE